jgi:hypothetical protein
MLVGGIMVVALLLLFSPALMLAWSKVRGVDPHSRERRKTI